MSRRQKILILGGGISGLTLAHRLQELYKGKRGKPQILLLEASERLGGMIRTLDCDGFTLEAGPDAFLSDKPAIVDLCRRLGLEDELLPTQELFRRSFILKNKKLHELPEGFNLIAPTSWRPFLKSRLVGPLSKARVFLERFIPRKKTSNDESVARFLKRRLGKGLYQSIAKPMLAGVYAADLEKLSVQAALPRFTALEEQHGSILKGLAVSARGSQHIRGAKGPRYSMFLSFKNGMRTITDRLIERTRGVNFHMNEFVANVAHNGKWKIRTESGVKFEADVLCVALSAARSALILKEALPGMSDKLSSIPYEPAAIVKLAFREKDLAHIPPCFGFVIADTEESPLLGCSFSSYKFKNRAPDDFAIMRIFIGGERGRPHIEKTDSEMVSLVQSELERLLNFTSTPLFYYVHRYRNAMPQYHMGHLDRIAGIEKECRKHKGLYLAGGYFRGVGIPDCVSHAEATAERISRYLDSQDKKSARKKGPGRKKPAAS